MRPFSRIFMLVFFTLLIGISDTSFAGKKQNRHNNHNGRNGRRVRRRTVGGHSGMVKRLGQKKGKESKEQRTNMKPKSLAASHEAAKVSLESLPSCLSTSAPVQKDSTKNKKNTEKTFWSK